MMRIRRYAKGPRPNTDFPYNDIMGKWWLDRAVDRAHQRAYKNITAFIRTSIPRSPQLIVDYACGAGDLLSLLGLQFPDSDLIGLDGSSLLLDLAEKRLSSIPSNRTRRISLFETALPKQSGLEKRADLAVYCFPNMTPASDEEGKDMKLTVNSTDARIAQYLSEVTEPGDEELPLSDLEAIQHTLLYGRCISHNLRQLLIRNGICVRVEYATSQRHEWSSRDLLLVSFEEGSLDMEVAGIKPRPWFRVLASAYFRSKVLEDVYHQTGDERDKNGGYLITVLRAL
jgi:hypothetical protein